MEKLLAHAAIAGRRTLLLGASGVLLLLSDPGSLFSQEIPGFHLPDSLRTRHDSFFVPSMSPGLSYISPRFSESQLSLVDLAAIDNGLHAPYQDSWKRSFLLGAASYTGPISLPPTWRPGKETFFQKIQMVLGVAELAGAAYLGYKAIKKEPITKKK